MSVSSILPWQRGKGMIEGECIFIAQKKWHLVNLSIDKKIWKIDQNLLRLTHPLKDWPKPLKDCPKPLEEKSNQNLWKVDFNFSFWKFAGRQNRQSSFLIQIFQSAQTMFGPTLCFTMSVRVCVCVCVHVTFNLDWKRILLKSYFRILLVSKVSI